VQGLLAAVEAGDLAAVELAERSHWSGGDEIDELVVEGFLSVKDLASLTAFSASSLCGRAWRRRRG